MVQMQDKSRVPGEASDDDMRESEVSNPPSENAVASSNDNDRNAPAEIPNDDQTPQPQPERA